MLRLQFWRYRKYPFIAITPRLTLTLIIVPVRILSVGQIDLFKNTHIQYMGKKETSIQKYWYEWTMNEISYPLSLNLFINWSFRIHQLHLYIGVRTPMNVLDMTLNCIWWWRSSSGALGKKEYPFITIALRSNLILGGSTY